LEDSSKSRESASFSFNELPELEHWRVHAKIMSPGLARMPEMRRLEPEGNMPIYEFTCLDCGAEFESLVRKPSDADTVQCPGCKSKNLEEKFSSFASVSTGGASTSSNCAPSGG
jgi:putative FmdB family regulatory protein